MQKKTLLYIFGITAFLGLVLGGVFFTNEVRLKIIQGPDKNQFAAESDQLNLSAVDKIFGKKNPNPSAPAASSPAVPQAPEQTGPFQRDEEKVPAGPETSPETDSEPSPPAPAEEKNSFSFAVLGDTQRFDPDNTSGSLQKAVKSIEGKNVGLVMTVGDLLSSCDGKSGCEKKLGEWKNTLGSLSSKTYEVMGNHDRTGGGKADELWQKVFDLPQNGPEGYKELAYSFDFENSHFVVLDSEKPDEHVVDKKQRDWLEKDLNDNKKDNTFVFFHEPAYPVSSKIGESLDVEKNERDALWKIMKDKKVTAVFNGHEHIQSRRKVEGVLQFVFGNTDSFDHDLPTAGVADYSHKGEGFGLVEVKDKEVIVKVYSADGEVLDSYKISG